MTDPTPQLNSGERRTTHRPVPCSTAVPESVLPSVWAKPASRHTAPAAENYVTALRSRTRRHWSSRVWGRPTIQCNNPVGFNPQRDAVAPLAKEATAPASSFLRKPPSESGFLPATRATSALPIGLSLRACACYRSRPGGLVLPCGAMEDRRRVRSHRDRFESA